MGSPGASARARMLVLLPIVASLVAGTRLQPGEPSQNQPGLYGLTWAWYFCQGWNASVVSTFRALSASSGRFPGGTGASFWDWGGGKLLNTTQVASCVVDRGFAANCSSVHDCSAACCCDCGRQPLCDGAASAGAPLSAEAVRREVYEPAGVGQMVWQPNLFFDWRNQSLSWLGPAMQSAGGPLRLVELGNEHYLDANALMMPTAADYVRLAAPTARGVQAARGRVGLTAEPVGPLEGPEQAAWLLREDPRRRQWNLNMSLAAGAAGLVADAWVIHSYRLSGAALNGSTDPADWPSAAMLYAEASLLNAREYVDALAGPATEIWLTEYGVSAPCMPWPDCPIGPGESHAKNVWFRDAVYSPVHAFGLLGNLLHALSTPAARVTAANVHSVFGAFYTARGMVQVLRGAGPAGADALNVSVLAQVYAHAFAVARRATAVRTFAPVGLAPRLALNFSVAGRRNFSAVTAVGFGRGEPVLPLLPAPTPLPAPLPVREDVLLLNRGGTPLELQLDVRAPGLHYRVAAYASDAPATIAGFATIDPARPPALPWPGPMPVRLSAAVSEAAVGEGHGGAAVLRLTLAPLSLLVVEEQDGTP